MTDNTPNKNKVQEQALATLEDVKGITVTDQNTLDIAGNKLKIVKTTLKNVDSVYRPILDRMNAQKKATMEEMKTYTEPLQKAEKLIKGAIGSFAEAQERAAAAEQARKDKIARQEAEDQRLRDAQALQDAGHEEEAERALETPVVTAAVHVAPVAKAEGVSTRKKYSGKVVSLKALVVAIAKGEAPITLIKPDMTAINQLVRATKEATDISGIEVVTETVVAGRI